MKDAHFPETVIDLNFYRDWLSKRASQRDKDKNKPTCFVTLSRQFGCDGYGPALHLTERLTQISGSQWSLFTRQMIEEIVSTEDIAPEMVRQISENRWSFKDWFVDALVPDYLQSHSTVVFGKMKKFILNLADKGNCVILGAGAQTVTHQLDPRKFIGVHVRVVASREWRLKKIAKHFKISREEAEKLLQTSQTSRDKFISDFTGLDTTDPCLYNIVLNNARSTSDVMVETVAHYLETSGAI